METVQCGSQCLIKSWVSPSPWLPRSEAPKCSLAPCRCSWAWRGGPPRPLSSSCLVTGVIRIWMITTVWFSFLEMNAGGFCSLAEWSSWIFFIPVLLVWTAPPALEDPLSLSACPVRSSSREQSEGLVDNRCLNKTYLDLSWIGSIPTAEPLVETALSLQQQGGSAGWGGLAQCWARRRVGAAEQTQSLPAGLAVSLALKI